MLYIPASIQTNLNIRNFLVNCLHIWAVLGFKFNTPQTIINHKIKSINHAKQQQFIHLPQR